MLEPLTIAAALALASPCPALPLFGDPSLQVNAWTDQKTGIVITRGMLRATKTPDELAFVIAHEQAHACLKGGSEYAADKLGQEIAVKAGFSPNAAWTFLHRVKGSALAFLSLSHPSNGARIRRLYGDTPK